MPNGDNEILMARVDSLEKQVSELSIKQNEIKQFVPKGVNYKLISANSANPGHTHTGSSISALDAGDITTGLLALARGGTNKALVVANGQVVYSDTDSLELTTGGSANQVLTQGTPPTWANVPVRRISAFNAEASVVNTITETDLMNFTLTGGSLSTTGILWVKIFIQKLDATSGTLTIRGYYGATSVSDVTTVTNGITNNRGYLEFWLLGTGATNTQDIDFRLNTSSGELIRTINATADPTLSVGIVGSAGTTAAIDSTVNQTVKVTAQWSVASTANDIRAAYGFALLLSA